MGRKRVQKFLGDAIGIGVEKTDPGEVLDLRELLQENRQAIAKAEIFAVGSGVLADEGYFPRAGSGKIFSFANDRFKAAAAKRAAQLGNDAKRAGMIAAFGDLDIRLMLRRGDDARR